MKRGVLRFEKMNADSQYQTAFKTKHGRHVYLKIEIADDQIVIQNCHYLDRPTAARPKKLTTCRFHQKELLNIIANELDRHFYDVEFIKDGQECDYDAFLARWQRQFHRKYKFLIMVGEGEQICGLPTALKTRLKNRNYRSIYLELHHYNDNLGVVTDCHYFDKKYRQTNRMVTPPTLRAVFFKYSRDAVINLVNTELNCDFSHLLVITDGSIDIENKLPLCGNL